MRKDKSPIGNIRHFLIGSNLILRETSNAKKEKRSTLHIFADNFMDLKIALNWGVLKKFISSSVADIKSSGRGYCVDVTCLVPVSDVKYELKNRFGIYISFS